MRLSVIAFFAIAHGAVSAQTSADYFSTAPIKLGQQLRVAFDFAARPQRADTLVINLGATSNGWLSTQVSLYIDKKLVATTSCSSSSVGCGIFMAHDNPYNGPLAVARIDKQLLLKILNGNAKDVSIIITPTFDNTTGAQLSLSGYGPHSANVAVNGYSTFTDLYPSAPFVAAVENITRSPEGIYSYSFSSTSYHGAITLIEKNGALWAAAYFGGEVIYGAFGEFEKPAFNNRFAEPISLTSSIVGDNLTHTLSYKGLNDMFIGDNIKSPGPRQMNWNTELELPANNYYSIIGARNGVDDFVLSVLNKNGKFNGSFGNCTFDGKLKDVKNRFYKEVDFTYGPNCTKSYPVANTPIKKGTKMTGVLIGTVVNGYTTVTQSMMLIIKDEKNTIGFAIMLAR